MKLWMCAYVQQEEDAKKLKSLASFKAQFANVLASKPFVPSKSNRPLTGNTIYSCHLCVYITGNSVKLIEVQMMMCETLVCLWYLFHLL